MVHSYHMKCLFRKLFATVDTAIGFFKKLSVSQLYCQNPLPRAAAAASHKIRRAGGRIRRLPTGSTASCPRAGRRLPPRGLPQPCRKIWRAGARIHRLLPPCGPPTLPLDPPPSARFCLYVLCLSLSLYRSRLDLVSCGVIPSWQDFDVPLID